MLHLRSLVWRILSLSVLLLSLGLFVQARDAAQPKVLVIAQAGDIATIDNQQSVGPAKNALIQIYDWQWLKFKPVAGPGGQLTVDNELLPGIIEAWESEEQADGSVIYRFHIRPGAMHHSGNPITAEDFKFTLLRRAAFRRDYLHRFLGGMYDFGDGLEESINVVDNLTFEVHAKKKMPLFWALWAQRTYFDSKLILENATKDDPWGKAFVAKNDAGSGPYVIKSWDVGTEMRLQRFEDFWGPRPPIDTLIFRTVPDLTTRLLLLKNGDVDVALNLPLRELNSLRDDPNIKIISAPSTNQLAIGMNHDIAPFDNADLRKALAYAFPYSDVIPSIYLGQAQPMYGPIPTGIEGALSEPRYTTDLDKARDLLERAGFSSGLSLSLKWETGFPQHEQIGILFRENLRKIGVDLKLQQLPVGQFETGVREHTLDFFIRESLAWIRTPEYVNLIDFQSQSSANPTGYANERVDELILEALNEADPDKRNELNLEAQEIILDDLPWIFIAQPNFQLAMRANVVGYVAQNTELHHFWLVDKQ